MHCGYGLEYVRRQPIPMVRRLLITALEKREEGKAWEMWLALYPHMILPQPGAKRPPLKFIPFSKFYEGQSAPRNDELTAEQIIVKFEDIKNRHQKRLK